MQPAWGVEQDTEGNANKAFDHLVEAYQPSAIDLHHFPPKEIIEAFSKIHLANPAKFVNPYIIGIFENRLVVEKH